MFNDYSEAYIKCQRFRERSKWHIILIFSVSNGRKEADAKRKIVEEIKDDSFYRAALYSTTVRKQMREGIEERKKGKRNRKWQLPPKLRHGYSTVQVSLSFAPEHVA